MNNIEKNKKVLVVATVDSHILNFQTPYLKLLKDKGFEVHVCTGENGKIPYCDKKHAISISRSPYKIGNIKAIKQLRKIIDENNYEFIECHTPMGSVVTRLAARHARKHGTKVLYTAHGFHFYKGAPLLNWIIYYPIEKWLSKYTDTLVTINKEDYEFSIKKFKKIKNIEYINGIGLDNSKLDIEITEKELANLRKKIGIDEKNVVLSYVAELNKNKNQILLIKAVEQLIKQGEKNYMLLLVGDGILKQYYQKYIEEKGLTNNIKLLGKRKDIPQILKLTDIYVASSLREGLPVNVLEAMYMELPIIATDNRGHRELINNNSNAYLIDNKIEELKNRITDIKGNIKVKWNMQKYLLEDIKKQLVKIYNIDKEQK